MNLTRIENREAAEVGHVADSLTLLPYLPPQGHRLADIGSGGGVPGIPLAIARPDVAVMLIESTQKKAAFLKEAEAVGFKEGEAVGKTAGMARILTMQLEHRFGPLPEAGSEVRRGRIKSWRRHLRR